MKIINKFTIRGAIYFRNICWNYLFPTSGSTFSQTLQTVQCLFQLKISPAFFSWWPDLMMSSVPPMSFPQDCWFFLFKVPQTALSYLFSLGSLSDSQQSWYSFWSNFIWPPVTLPKCCQIIRSKVSIFEWFFGLLCKYVLCNSDAFSVNNANYIMESDYSRNPRPGLAIRLVCFLSLWAWFSFLLVSWECGKKGLCYSSFCAEKQNSVGYYGTI